MCRRSIEAWSGRSEKWCFWCRSRCRRLSRCSDPIFLANHFDYTSNDIPSCQFCISAPTPPLAHCRPLDARLDLPLGLASMSLFPIAFIILINSSTVEYLTCRTIFLMRVAVAIAAFLDPTIWRRRIEATSASTNL